MPVVRAQFEQSPLTVLGLLISSLGCLLFWTQLGSLAWLGQVVLGGVTAGLFFALGVWFQRLWTLALLDGVRDSLSVDTFSVPAGANPDQALLHVLRRLAELDHESRLLEEAYVSERARLVGLGHAIHGFVLALRVGQGGEVTVEQVDESVERLTRLTAQAIKQDWTRLVEAFNTQHAPELRRMITHPDPFPARESLVLALAGHQSQPLVWMQVTVVRQAIAAGVRLHLVAVDVTDLVQARQMAESADKAKSEFLATMSHELRTPLNAIVGFSRLLQDQASTDQQRDDARQIGNAASSLNAILTDILDFSRIQAQGLRLDIRPFDLRDLLKGLITLNGTVAQQKHLEFGLTCEPERPVWVRGDELRLRQVVQNLLSNALKFTSTGYVKVRLSTVKAEPGRVSVSIEVADSGIGISRVNLKKLFNRFTQADRGINRRFGGTGLGLAISKGLVELMDGRIDATSEPGVGSVFSVLLNLQETEAPLRQMPGDGLTATSDGLQLLVVDDHPINVKLLERYLSRRGHRIETALSGHDAVLACEKTRFEGILMDLDMPDMDGFETTRAIRRLEGSLNADTWICAVSGLSDQATLDQCTLVGIQAHLTKPIAFDRLDAHLQRLIDEKVAQLGKVV